MSISMSTMSISIRLCLTFFFLYYFFLLFLSLFFSLSFFFSLFFSLLFLRCRASKHLRLSSVVKLVELKVPWRVHQTCTPRSSKWTSLVLINRIAAGRTRRQYWAFLNVFKQQNGVFDWRLKASLKHPALLSTLCKQQNCSDH